MHQGAAAGDRGGRVFQPVQRQHRNRQRAAGGQFGHCLFAQGPDHDCGALRQGGIIGRAGGRVGILVEHQYLESGAAALAGQVFVIAGQVAVAHRPAGSRQPAAQRQDERRLVRSRRRRQQEAEPAGQGVGRGVLRVVLQPAGQL